MPMKEKSLFDKITDKIMIVVFCIIGLGLLVWLGIYTGFIRYIPPQNVIQQAPEGSITEKQTLGQ